jgi:dynactin complex subunit
MAENEVAVVNSIRADMAESFVQGLKGLFEEHNVTIPDEQVDVVEALSTQLAEAEAKLDELVTEVSSLKEELSDKTIETAFDEVAEGIVMTQAEKLRTLVEDISFDGTVDDYKKKVSIIKEKHFPVGKQTTVAPQTLSEEVDGAAGDLNENVVLNGPMKKYAEAISKSLRR